MRTRRRKTGMSVQDNSVNGVHDIQLKAGRSRLYIGTLAPVRYRVALSTTPCECLDSIHRPASSLAITEDLNAKNM